MKAKTYDDWRMIGYQVKAGERSTLKDAKGRRVFTRDQVEERRDFDRVDDGREGGSYEAGSSL